MGNSIKNKNKFIDYDNDFFSYLDEDNYIHLKDNYKIVEVEMLDPITVSIKMFGDDYFKKFPEKKKVIQSMVKYYLQHNDKSIYEQTDYLCNEREKICICNLYARELRKSIEGKNYKSDNAYISWCKRENDKF